MTGTVSRGFILASSDTYAPHRILAGVTDASYKVVQQVAALNALRDELRARFIRKPNALLLLDRLFVTNVLAAQ